MQIPHANIVAEIILTAGHRGCHTGTSDDNGASY